MMDAWLTRLERRFGKLAVENLALLIVGGMAAAYLLGSLRPTFFDALTLDVAAIRRGEVWRLVTYLFLPRTENLFFFVFELYLTWIIGSSLETAWGSFKFNVYYLVGMVGTTVAAWLTQGSPGNTYLNTSLFLAFATVFPDQELLLFFVLPVRMRWLGILSGVLLALDFVKRPWDVRGAILAAVFTYLLFFGGALIDLFRSRARRSAWKQGGAPRTSMRPSQPAPSKSTPPPSSSPMGARVCAICGAKETDGADIRVCSCPRCGGTPRNLCLEHARNH